MHKSPTSTERADSIAADLRIPADLRIWPRHLYTIPVGARFGYCASGARAWFAAHGLSWADFVAGGIAASTMAATGDPLALALVQHAAEQERSTSVSEAEHGR